ncbi:hypothetical protein [Hymenobacter pini]|uniref:hypothetical protein n=1 Tax=Hymenobacter pini TaxID=2880879 RepID=UPI001CF170DE|nr:hypothetical protein [Hymenobacter pini]MCA8833184.1 hypothetical protein [Hymenobacter pini]
MRVPWLLALSISLCPALALAQQLPPPVQSLTRQVQQAPLVLPTLPVKEAHRTLSAVRRRFQNGLPTGAQLYVVARGLNEAATPELLVVRVLTWPTPQLTGQIVRLDNNSTAPVEVPESAVQDWLLLYPDGREEGNYLGKFWDLEERLTEQE